MLASGIPVSCASRVWLTPLSLRKKTKIAAKLQSDTTNIDTSVSNKSGAWLIWYLQHLKLRRSTHGTLGPLSVPIVDSRVPLYQLWKHNSGALTHCGVLCFNLSAERKKRSPQQCKSINDCWTSQWLAQWCFTPLIYISRNKWQCNGWPFPSLFSSPNESRLKRRHMAHSWWSAVSTWSTLHSVPTSINRPVRDNVSLTVQYENHSKLRFPYY